MSKDNRITLKEMAQRLSRCPKTFRKYVTEYQIPHICLGRDMLFDATEVESHLSQMTKIKQNAYQLHIKPTAGKHKNKSRSDNKANDRYASLLGLS